MKTWRHGVDDDDEGKKIPFPGVEIEINLILKLLFLMVTVLWVTKSSVFLDS
jgi:hypothetical protein